MRRQFLVALVLLTGTLLALPGRADDSHPVCLRIAGKIRSTTTITDLEKLKGDAVATDCSSELQRKIDDALEVAKSKGAQPGRSESVRVAGNEPKKPPVIRSQKIPESWPVAAVPPPPKDVVPPKPLTCPLEDSLGWIDVRRGSRGDVFSGSSQQVLNGAVLSEGATFAIPDHLSVRVHRSEHPCELATECQWSADRSGGRFEAVRIVPAGRSGQSQRLQVCIRPVG